MEGKKCQRAARAGDQRNKRGMHIQRVWSASPTFACKLYHDRIIMDCPQRKQINKKVERKGESLHFYFDDGGVFSITGIF
jgi:hypothetical protein